MNAIEMTAKFGGKCTSCGGIIHAGTRILWTKGAGSRHSSCPGASAAVRSIGPSVVTSLSPAAEAGIAARKAARVTGRAGRRTGCACGSREDSHGQLIPSRYNCSHCEHDA